MYGQNQMKTLGPALSKAGQAACGLPLSRNSRGTLDPDRLLRCVDRYRTGSSAHGEYLPLLSHQCCGYFPSTVRILSWFFDFLGLQAGFERVIVAAVIAPTLLGIREGSQLGDHSTRDSSLDSPSMAAS